MFLRLPTADPKETIGFKLFKTPPMWRSLFCAAFPPREAILLYIFTIFALSEWKYQLIYYFQSDIICNMSKILEGFSELHRKDGFSP